jgi:hypothetical protein
MLEAWKRSKKYQGAKMEEVQAKVAKIGLSGLGYQSIWFFLKR